MKNELQINSAAGFLGSTSRLAVNRYRPFVGSDGQSYVMNSDGKSMMRVNDGALLRYDEWKDIDQTVIKVATDRLRGIADLIESGLTHNLGSIGITVSQWEEESDMTDANYSMSGVTEGEEDTPAYNLRHIPVPIIHKDFRLNIRRLEASRRFGESLDVSAASIAGRKVAEGSEDMLFRATPIQVEGGTIYGYTTFPERNTVAMNTPWDSVTDNDDIVEDVLAMLTAASEAKFHGPFRIYVPTQYEAKLDSDLYPDSGDTRTVRERILQIPRISSIEVADRLEGDNVVMAQMTRDVVDLAIAQDISTIQWQTKGGMVEHFKTMAVWVPRLKADYDGRCGIVHLAPEEST